MSGARAGNGGVSLTGLPAMVARWEQAGRFFDLDCVDAGVWRRRCTHAAAGDVSNMCPFCIRSEFNPVRGCSPGQCRPLHTI